MQPVEHTAYSDSIVQIQKIRLKKKKRKEKSLRGQESGAELGLVFKSLRDISCLLSPWAPLDLNLY